MAISDEFLVRARDMLSHAARPLFFYDDDCDGVSCYVMCVQFCRDGHGVCVKQSPVLNADYLRKVEEYQPDLIVVLDKPGIEEEFLRNVSQDVLWIDHHEPQEEVAERFRQVTYLNPRLDDDLDNRPTSYWTYLITRTNLWMAAVGTVGDWYAPNFLEEFGQQYPGMLPETYERVEDIYLGSRLGLLIKVLQFNLKGATTDVRKSISTLTKIGHPDEILGQTTARGRYIWKKYRRLADRYDRHVQRAVRQANDSGEILLYEYDHDGQTFTSELSNELLIRFPEKITIVCRKHDGQRKCSIRSRSTELPDRLRKALEGLAGRGGGHTNACGLVIDEEDWDEFYGRFARLTAS